MSQAWAPQYRRWEGKGVGLWQRRLSILRYGLRLGLAGRTIKASLILVLAQSLMLSVLFFLFGQLVTPQSTLLLWLEASGGEELGSFIDGFSAWFLLYPEICVDGIYRIAFYLLSFGSPFLSLVIGALFVHQLIANDLASNAIVIYGSKALSVRDYVLGKFLIASCLFSLVWLAPAVISWCLGNVLSPDWSFFYHSFPSLLRAISLGLAGVVSLSCLALLASCLARSTGAAVTYWILGWLSLSVVGRAASYVHPALEYINPIAALKQLSAGIFRMGDFVSEASGMLPFFGNVFGHLGKTPDSPELLLGNGELLGPILALAVYSAFSLFIVSRRALPS